jgi:hypothetical protein
MPSITPTLPFPQPFLGVDDALFNPILVGMPHLTTRILTMSGSVSGLAKALSAIYREAGVFGLYQGHTATILRIFPYAAIKFMVYVSTHTVFELGILVY